MVEFVDELEKLLAIPGHSEAITLGLRCMIVEAKKGEYHDYKNVRYDCGKVASSTHLRGMGFVALAQRIEGGEFDEEADEQDKAMLKKDALEGGFTAEQCEKLFGI